MDSVNADIMQDNLRHVMDIQGHGLPTGHKRQGEEENLSEIEKLLVDLLLAKYCIRGKKDRL